MPPGASRDSSVHPRRLPAGLPARLQVELRPSTRAPKIVLLIKAQRLKARRMTVATDPTIPRLSIRLLIHSDDDDFSGVATTIAFSVPSINTDVELMSQLQSSSYTAALDGTLLLLVTTSEKL